MKKRCVVSTLAIALLATPAFAATEADCEAAIRQAQADAEQSPIIAEQEGRADRLATELSRAGEEGIRGNYEKCLTIVKDARGGAGLEE
jgi:hypothetical protein